MKKHLAFTLAEVLIALTIIGVISVLTVPSLITNVDNQTNMTKLKKAYGIINQVVGIEIAESGSDCVNAEAFTTQGVTMQEGLASIIAKNVSGNPLNNHTWKGSDGLIYNVGNANAACTNYNVAEDERTSCGFVTVITKGTDPDPDNLTTLDADMNLSGGAGFELPYFRNGVYYPTSTGELTKEGITTSATTSRAAAARVIFGTVGKKGQTPIPVTN